MATKKSTAKKKSTENTMLESIAEKVGHLAGEIAAGKDHLVEMAGDAINSVKATFHHITAPNTKKTVLKKSAGKIAPAKKLIKKAAVKLVPVKKAAGKTTKKSALAKKLINKKSKKVSR